METYEVSELCVSCLEMKPTKVFVTYHGKKTINCNVCRAKFLQKINSTQGLKLCSTCKKNRPVEEFTKKISNDETKVFVNCRQCRTEFYRKKIIDDIKTKVDNSE